MDDPLRRAVRRKTLNPMRFDDDEQSMLHTYFEQYGGGRAFMLPVCISSGGQLHATTRYAGWPCACVDMLQPSMYLLGHPTKEFLTRQRCDVPLKKFNVLFSGWLLEADSVLA